MRTNIVIDNSLMRQAMKATGLSTKKAVVEEGLRTLIKVKGRKGYAACVARLSGKEISVRCVRIGSRPLHDHRRYDGMDRLPSWNAHAHTDWLDRQLTRERLGLTDLILCEVLQRISQDRQFAAVQAELLRFEIFEAEMVELAVEAALNYRRLRAAGRTVRKTIDSLIATFCLMEGHSLLHNDRDYDLFEDVLGLKVVHP